MATFQWCRKACIYVALLTASCSERVAFRAGDDAATDPEARIDSGGPLDDIHAAPSDDPADWPLPVGQPEPMMAGFRWVIPDPGIALEAECDVANNNVDIQFHDGRLFMAWRTARTHFAGPEARLLIASAVNGSAWEHEGTIALGTDVREPRFLSFQGQLQLLFFQGGTNPLAFEPKGMFRVRRIGAGSWSTPEALSAAPEVPWDIKVRGGVAYMTSYTGEHYGEGSIKLEVHFKESLDGEVWSHVGGRPSVYEGGVSEAAFELDEEGNLWAVTRNEDGDETGFGSHVCFAAAQDISDWECSPASDPDRYDSPELFRYGREIYLAARRDVGGPYDQQLNELTFAEKKSKYLMDYSLRPKRSALYRIDRARRQVVFLMEIPGVGDTAFPSVRRQDGNSFLLTNYSSPLNQPDLTWLEGQINPAGTSIYLMEVRF